MLSWWEWIFGVAVVAAVVLLRWVLVDYLLDRFNPPETRWPPKRDRLRGADRPT
jgi:hypothetical protein